MISSSLKNSILALTLSALIATAEARKGAKKSSSSDVPSIATCTSTSPQCCWVVRSWQLMGKTTTVSSTNATACCSMTGVTCDSSNKVRKIVWGSKGLSGSIPAEIGNLVNLTHL